MSTSPAPLSAMTASGPLDVFETHQAALVREIEVSVQSVAGHCRDADIIDLKLHDELVLVPGSSRHKAKKLVNAIADRIEAQPDGVDQKQCCFQRFVGVLRKNSSFDEIAGKLESSLTGIQESTGNPLVACTEDDPLDKIISNSHIDEIGKHLSHWKKWARALGLTNAQITGIETDKNLDYNMVSQEVLILWKKAYIATYRALCDVAVKINECEMGEVICKMVNGKFLHFSYRIILYF